MLAVGRSSGQASNGGQNSAKNDDQGSAKEFVSLAKQGLELDYNPLASPADAVEKADLIVAGTIVDVTDGITFGGPNGQAAGRGSSYVTAIIEVDRVLDGNAAEGKRVYAMIPKANSINTQDPAKLNTKPRVVAELDDISSWTPAAGVQVVRPSSVPADVALYTPYTDGLWLQGARDPEMLGVHAEPSELAPGWGQVRTLDDYVSALSKATGK